MKKPVLVVMAAGMGSRYGGLKQLDPVGGHGQLIIDYSIYDAKRAGFETVIKHAIEESFKAGIGDRLAKVMEVKYAYQELDDLPVGYAVPEGRVKPWGTCHAVLAARHVVEGPFAVINADDYYGPEAFQEIYSYLCSHPDSRDSYEYAMWGISWAIPSPSTAMLPAGSAKRQKDTSSGQSRSAPTSKRRGMTPAIPRTVVSHGPRFPGVPSCP